MTSEQFLNINTNVLIAGALMMIMFFLAYIAYRLSELKSLKKPSKAKV